MPFGLLTLAALTALSLAIPSVGIVICVAALALQLCVIAVRLVPAAAFGAVSRAGAGSTVRPIFSVHVATHNEPAEVVIATLRALRRQEWPDSDFEVIVLDNNTRDPALWRPVEHCCRALGDNFRFFHREGVQGAKAGALNIALSLTRADATHVVVVDADYIVAPRFLRTAAKALSSSGADYLQFPQAYTNSGGRAQGVDAELEEYFLNSAPRADCAEALLLTGTLSVISKPALVAAGAWSGVTTTEDAELGLRLCRNEFTGRYVPEIVGQGLLPFSLGDLEKQRYRWCSGNLRTILLHLGALVSARSRIELRKRIAILSQLTAWQNFSLVPAMVLLLGLLIGSETAFMMNLAAATIVLSLCDSLWRLGRRAVMEGDNWTRTLLAVTSRIALAPVSARATFDALLPRNLRFVVTAKNCRYAGQGFCPETLMLALVSLVALPAAFAAGPLATLAVAVLILPFPAGVITHRGLDRYREVTLGQATGVPA